VGETEEIIRRWVINLWFGISVDLDVFHELPPSVGKAARLSVGLVMDHAAQTKSFYIILQSHRI